MQEALPLGRVKFDLKFPMSQANESQSGSFVKSILKATRAQSSAQWTPDEEPPLTPRVKTMEPLLERVKIKQISKDSVPDDPISQASDQAGA